MKVMIVDDSRVARAMIVIALKKVGPGGLDIVQCANGCEALEAIESDCPNLVICDWHMPEMNGLDLLVTLRKRGNGVRFGFVTSDFNPVPIAGAKAAGADFVIRKPCTVDDVRSTLAEFLIAQPMDAAA